jgi:type II secretory pathway component GspD/PulD (secretin)
MKTNNALFFATTALYFGLSWGSVASQQALSSMVASSSSHNSSSIAPSSSATINVASSNSVASIIDKSSPITSQMDNPHLKVPITLRAQNANLSEVMMVLSERSGMNFVAANDVTRDSVSIILNNTPLQEAVDMLVRAAGLSYEISGNSVLIAESGKLKDEVGQSSYVIELRYANAVEVAKMLSDITKNIKIDEGGNRLVVFTSPRIIGEIERIIKAIDHPHILVQLETRLIEVSENDGDKLGINWASFSPITMPLAHGGDFKLNNFTQGQTALQLTLDALIQSGKARLLSNAKLMTTNNRQASLHIGDVIPYSVRQVNVATGNAGTTTNEEKEVGVKLVMTPHVNEEHQVTLNLEPEVSTIVAFIGANQDLPQTRVRKATTTVRVQDGQTIFIAGLFSEDQSEVTEKLPIFGDIPLIGYLFTHKTHKKTKSNLIIEITPRIILDDAQANAIAKQ